MKKLALLLALAMLLSCFGTSAAALSVTTVQAELSLPDGRIAKVTVDVSEWPQYVSGLELERVFDGTLFAG